VSLCSNCGDNSGWTLWFPRDAKTGRIMRVWAACADCNDDQLKPKPDCCEGCGEKATECACSAVGVE
jgi:hypothetical protein